jgi:Resolvase, N terminal domain
VTYLRISKSEQALSGLGIDAQRATVADYAERKGMTIVGEYCDEGISAKSLKGRPAAPRALAPDLPDADHGQVGPVQAVTTVTACRKPGAKSGRHHDTRRPRRWSRFKPSPSGQFGLSRRPRRPAPGVPVARSYSFLSPRRILANGIIAARPPRRLR